MLPKNHRRTFICLQKGSAASSVTAVRTPLPKNVAEPMLQVGRASRRRPSLAKYYQKSSGEKSKVSRAQSTVSLLCFLSEGPADGE
jgi:hypothetical protein